MGELTLYAIKPFPFMLLLLIFAFHIRGRKFTDLLDIELELKSTNFTMNKNQPMDSKFEKKTSFSQSNALWYIHKILSSSIHRIFSRLPKVKHNRKDNGIDQSAMRVLEKNKHLRNHPKLIPKSESYNLSMLNVNHGLNGVSIIYFPIKWIILWFFYSWAK